MMLTLALLALPQRFLLVTDPAPWPEDTQVTQAGQPQDLTPWFLKSQNWRLCMQLCSQPHCPTHGESPPAVQENESKQRHTEQEAEGPDGDQVPDSSLASAKSSSPFTNPFSAQKSLKLVPDTTRTPGIWGGGEERGGDLQVKSNRFWSTDEVPFYQL